MRHIPSSLSTVLLAVGLGALAPSAAQAADTATTRLDVGIEVGADPAGVVAALGDGVTYHRVDGLNAIAVDVPPSTRAAALKTLTAHPDVRYAEVGAVLKADGDPLDTTNAPKFEEMTVPEARTWTTGRPDVLVAVLDTGVSPNPDLSADRLVHPRDVVDGDDDATDDDNHGTMVANLIAAADNGVGSTGVCSSCGIMPVRVLSHRDGAPAEGSSADVAAGIVWAADHGAKVINLSMSTPTRSTLLEEAVEYADGRDALIVAAAGNDPGSHRRYPAAIDSVPVLGVGTFTMGATNAPDDEWITLKAHSGFTVLDASGTPRRLEGTSGSAAVTSGVAALVHIGGQDGVPMRSAGWAIAAYAQQIHGFPGLHAAWAMFANGAPNGEQPTVSFEVLPQGQTAHRTLSVRPAASDDHMVTYLQLVVDGRVVQERYGRLTNEPLRWTPPAGFSGTLPVEVWANDFADTGRAPAVKVTFDNAGPVATSVTPAQNTRVRGTFTSALSGVTDKAGVAKAELTANGKVVGTDTTAPYSLAVKTGTTSGNVKLVWKLTDRLGNTRSYTRTVIADNTAPTVSITKAPKNKAKVKGTVKVYAKATDASGIARVELLVDGKVVATDRTTAYVLSVNVAKQKKTMKVQVRAYDKLGNVKSTSTRTWYRK
ncbi:S8 family serine peptidase [Actinoplanes sp. NBRC 101535]|uniref:S8 family serine peptidase n=1 Tax=Actinoplanes sp. NBRC 101535 TaxID=3032196 RepID=UPI0024A24140|nr:S8 family serine peptidase [Actinoplanes sp. NBRC 101535]GLY07253.1 hypothetical protein Acsp01_76320 [Actinoplanes sp. NBRC 101535]